MLRLRGAVSRATEWDVAVDLFFYRDAEELEKVEEIQKSAAAAEAGRTWAEGGEGFEAAGDEAVVAAPAASGEWDGQGDWGAAEGSGW